MIHIRLATKISWYPISIEHALKCFSAIGAKSKTIGENIL